ncbi:MAG TPA: RNA polymerase sigma factor FliA [Xanthomonadaceae bacterium]|jgi:RNA polymerase sigma factor for flagellar operon FliA|nr:RNA polymerase sigma factor FliA [Xanthomonadaceae bacterium]
MIAPAAQYRAVQRSASVEVVERHAELVRRIAHHLAARLPASVEIDDLVQAGMLGLIEAARNFDSDQGASFETYASIRIRGAMIDEIRKGDWTPRSVHRRTREAAEATRRIEQASGRAATGAEIAEALGLAPDEYARLLEDAVSGQVLSLDSHVEDHGEVELPAGPGASPERELQAMQFQQALAAVIGELPERERLVLSLYYEQELNLREIGAVLGVSESRVCQIHGQAVLRLRARLEPFGSADKDTESVG